MTSDDPTPREGPLEENTPGEAEGGVMGAAIGAVLGGVAGSPAGPPGMITGAVGGAAAGTALGHATGAGGHADDLHERDALRQAPYFDPAYDFDDYAAAIRLGREARQRSDESFEALEPRLEEVWERENGGSRLKWQQARQAARGAWERAAPTPRPQP